MDRFKNSRPIADTGGSASGMDSRSVGLDASELESLDAQGKRSGVEIFGTGKETRASCSFDSKGSPRTGRRFREVPVRIWVKSNSVGWSHVGCSPEAAFQDNLEGSAGSVLDASSGLSTKTGWLYLSSGTERGGQTIWSGVKKNFNLWGLRKPLFLRTKPGLFSILVLG